MCRYFIIINQKIWKNWMKKYYEVVMIIKAKLMMQNVMKTENLTN